MKSIFIVYMPGHAGNFLARLFSLSPETVPQVPIDVLKESVIDTGQMPVIADRADYYSFDSATQYPSWQDFHRAWPDFYQRELFDHFNRLCTNPFPIIVYAIHPYEFVLLESDICRSDYDIFYVDLDDQWREWVATQQKKLGFRYRPDYSSELHQLENLRTRYNMKPISLTAMLSGIDAFLIEYRNLADMMSITPEIESAKKLYHGWIRLRGLNAR